MKNDISVPVLLCSFPFQVIL